jgi:hypothetical protein
MGQCAFLGTASVPDLIRESDPDVLMAVQAANVVALEMTEEHHKRAGQYVIKALAEAWK